MSSDPKHIAQQATDRGPALGKGPGLARAASALSASSTEGSENIAKNRGGKVLGCITPYGWVEGCETVADSAAHSQQGSGNVPEKEPAEGCARLVWCAAVSAMVTEARYEEIVRALGLGAAGPTVHPDDPERFW